jgi:hypothetical protein
MQPIANRTLDLTRVRSLAVSYGAKHNAQHGNQYSQESRVCFRPILAGCGQEEFGFNQGQKGTRTREGQSGSSSYKLWVVKYSDKHLFIQKRGRNLVYTATKI